jgi:uncharacterized protein YcfJ
MTYDALPQTVQNLLDGNLLPGEASTEPIFCVIGTAGQGYSETLYPATRVSSAANIFGTEGTLTRGLYEAYNGGARNIRMYRVGATSALLESVGTGITIETIAKDDSAGTDYKLAWEDTAGRLRVWRVSDNTLVYDNNPSYPLQQTDLGEVAVSGTASGSPGDIGTSSVPITMAAADGVSGASYTAGTDGVDLSRMKMYEVLYEAYIDLEDQEMDVICPMNVYLDDLNVMDLTASGITAASLTSLSDYPTAGAADDALGKVYVEEYEGDYYFWWWFPADPTAESFSAANIAPTVGSASTTTKIDGTALAASDFHEVNFAYQLAEFCHTLSTNVVDVTGVVGVKPPASYSPRDIARWVGTVPTYALNLDTGNNVISANGTGLLGNKFMGGRVTAGGLTGHTIAGVDGLLGGGFIGTDTKFLDDTQQYDENNALIDLGKYVSVVAVYSTLSNPSSTTSYVATSAGTYGGFYIGLPANEAPTNKKVGMVRLPYRLNVNKVDALANSKYVMFHPKPKGITVSDAPTAARAESDYRRLSTVRIVKAVVDEIRDAADPFLGRGMSREVMAALETRIDEICSQNVKRGYLNRYNKVLSATQQQRVLGQAVLDLLLVPAYELRQLTIVVSLAAI